jgi:hypothetical protein
MNRPRALACPLPRISPSTAETAAPAAGRRALARPKEPRAARLGGCALSLRRRRRAARAKKTAAVDGAWRAMVLGSAPSSAAGRERGGGGGGRGGGGAGARVRAMKRHRWRVHNKALTSVRLRAAHATLAPPPCILRPLPGNPCPALTSSPQRRVSSRVEASGLCVDGARTRATTTRTRQGHCCTTPTRDSTRACRWWLARRRLRVEVASGAKSAVPGVANQGEHEGEACRWILGGARGWTKEPGRRHGRRPPTKTRSTSARLPARRLPASPRHKEPAAAAAAPAAAALSAAARVGCFWSSDGSRARSMLGCGLHLRRSSFEGSGEEGEEEGESGGHKEVASMG